MSGLYTPRNSKVTWERECVRGLVPGKIVSSLKIVSDDVCMPTPDQRKAVTKHSNMCGIVQTPLIFINNYVVYPFPPSLVIWMFVCMVLSRTKSSILLNVHTACWREGKRDLYAALWFVSDFGLDMHVMSTNNSNIKDSWTGAGEEGMDRMHVYGKMNLKIVTLVCATYALFKLNRLAILS